MNGQDERDTDPRAAGWVIQRRGELANGGPGSLESRSGRNGGAATCGTCVGVEE